MNLGTRNLAHPQHRQLLMDVDSGRLGQMTRRLVEQFRPLGPVLFPLAAAEVVGCHGAVYLQPLELGFRKVLLHLRAACHFQDVQECFHLLMRILRFRKAMGKWGDTAEFGGCMSSDV